MGAMGHITKCRERNGGTNERTRRHHGSQKKTQGEGSQTRTQIPNAQPGRCFIPNPTMDAAALPAAQGGAATDATSTASAASQQKQRGAGGGGNDAGQPLPSKSKSKLAARKKRKKAELEAAATAAKRQQARRSSASGDDKPMAWSRTLDSDQPLLMSSGSKSKSEATTTTAKSSRTANGDQGEATADATASTASLKKQRGAGDDGDDTDQPMLLKPKAKRQSSSGIRTDDNNVKAAVQAIDPASRHACGTFRGFRPRVPLKPAAATSTSADSVNTGSEPPKKEATFEPTPEQRELVRQVQSGAIISILWRWGRSMGYNPGHKDGSILYYSGEDEYFSAKIMQWRKVRGRRLFRLIYDDGYVENDINLLEQTFRILHLQDPDEVKEEGGLFLV